MFHQTMNKMRTMAIIGGIAITGACFFADQNAVAQDCDPEEVQKLLWSDGASNDNFGETVDVCLNVAVVGMYNAHHDQINPGGAVVYRYDGTEWVEEATLFASDFADDDRFGWSVSIDGDAIVVGAYGNDDNGSYTGSAYVFRYDGNNWTEEAKLLASDGTINDHFGDSVSIDGDAIVVGAHGNTDNGPASGSAYVFRYDGSGWTEEAKLLASDGITNDTFGYSVSIDGDAIVVGAYGVDYNGDASGSAYVYRYDGDGWTEEAKLLASDGAFYDLFGLSVSIDGNVIVIGASNNDDNDTDSGSAYVYHYDGSGWTEEAKLLAFDGALNDRFGYSVSVDGDMVVVGTHGNDDSGTDSGSAYVFRYDGSVWVEEDKLLASDGATSDYFGYSVSIDGDSVVVGAYGDDDNGSNAGAAYVYDLNCSGCTDPSFILTADPFPLLAGEFADFCVSGATPHATTWLVYSLFGEGTHEVPQLNVTLCITNPIRIDSKRTNGAGETCWIIEIPDNSEGLDVWLQATQHGGVSNAVATWIN